MTEERPWTQRIVTDAWVEVFIGAYFRFTRDKKVAAEEMARDLKKFFKEHSEWAGTDVIVHEETALQCSFCNQEYEEDADGPVCCDRAQAAALAVGDKS